MRYRVLLNGENLAIRESGTLHKMGFVTTRYVDASTPSDAYQKASTLVLAEIMSFAEESPSDLKTKLKCLECEQVSWAKARLCSAKGFTFYRAEGTVDHTEVH